MLGAADQHAPRLQTMDANREIAFSGEVELPDEDFFLFGHRRARSGAAYHTRLFQNPLIQTDFTDDGGRGVKETDEFALPVGRPFADIPRMIAEGGQHAWFALREFQNGGPVFFARAVHDHAGDADGAERRENGIKVWREAVVLQVIVGVVEAHGYCRKRTQRAQRITPALRSLCSFAAIIIRQGSVV